MVIKEAFYCSQGLVLQDEL